jgi:hypothetical protein
MDTNFKGIADFAGTYFVRDVIFRSSHFYGDSSFGLASFSRFADFANVDFERTAFSQLQRSRVMLTSWT